MAEWSSHSRLVRLEFDKLYQSFGGGASTATSSADRSSQWEQLLAQQEQQGGGGSGAPVRRTPPAAASGSAPRPNPAEKARRGEHAQAARAAAIEGDLAAARGRSEPQSRRRRGGGGGGRGEQASAGGRSRSRGAVRKLAQHGDGGSRVRQTRARPQDAAAGRGSGGGPAVVRNESTHEAELLVVKRRGSRWWVAGVGSSGPAQAAAAAVSPDGGGAQRWLRQLRPAGVRAADAPAAGRRLPCLARNIRQRQRIIRSKLQDGAQEQGGAVAAAMRALAAAEPAAPVLVQQQRGRGEPSWLDNQRAAPAMPRPAARHSTQSARRKARQPAAAASPFPLRLAAASPFPLRSGEIDEDDFDFGGGASRARRR